MAVTIEALRFPRETFGFGVVMGEAAWKLEAGVRLPLHPAACSSSVRCSQ